MSLNEGVLSCVDKRKDICLLHKVHTVLIIAHLIYMANAYV